MAARAVSAALDQASIETLAKVSSAGKALSSVHLFLSEASAGANPQVAVCHVVNVRHGGFMLSIPNSMVVQEFLQLLDAGAEAQPEFHPGTVEVQNSRGRPVGEAEILLVDLPWDFAPHLSRPVNLKLAAYRHYEVVQLEADGQPGRPAKNAVMQLANAWIAGGDMEAGTAAEYATGEEFADAAEGPAGQESTGSGVDGAPVNNIELLNRIAELEGRLASLQEQPQLQVPLMPGPAPKAPPLFGTGASQLTQAQWSKINKLAGSPPPRLGSLETRRPVLQPKVAAVEQAHVLQEREAEEDAMLLDLTGPELQQMDPMQRMLALQLQQNQMLLSRLLPKSQDPVLGALSVSDSGSGGSSNIKGCLAREAFQRTIVDLPKVASLARLNALKELGLTPDREDSSLMRLYVEKRMPLAEQKLLAMFATMLAETWAVGFEQQDQVLLGSVARMMFFVEQAAIDGGRTQLAWLLSGYSEPAMHMMLSSKKKPGLEPFARLCPASWVSANVSYLRDLDYMESRLAQVGKPAKQTRAHLSDDDRDDKPKRPAAKPKAKGRGKGVTGSPPADASTAPS